MKQPENQSKKYTSLFNDIDEGRVKIPQFQRDFVWSKAQTAKLIDSIIKGFPMGTFILWKTKERLRHIRNVGNIDLPEPDAGDSIFYVLDGQQRITSLYAVRKGVRITRENKEIDYRDISIDLDVEYSQDEEVVFEDAHPEHTTISVYQLLNASIAELAKEYGDYLDAVSEYKTRLEGYDFSTVVIDSYSIDIACEIFTRINTGGKDLTLFEIMVAKTYDQDRNFDLSEKYNHLIEADSQNRNLQTAGYDGIPPVTVLQCVASFISSEIKRKNILKLDKQEFIDQWDDVTDALYKAVDYLRTHLGIQVSRILPYNSILIPLTWFFGKIGNRGITHRENDLLRQYVYFAALTHRFNSAAETKVTVDIKRMADIIAGKEPDYKGELPKLTEKDLIRESFSVGNATSKIMVCLLSERSPKSFKTNGTVILDNSWLKASTSKNYHHFFPKAFLKKQGFEAWEANSLMNIVLVDDYLNKREIRAKAPSIYIGKFAQENPDMNESLKSHFIDDCSEFGIDDDDYKKFILQRASLILQEINARLYPFKVSPEDSDDLESQSRFICPECGSEKESLIMMVETEPDDSNPWSMVLNRIECADCAQIIPAHLAQRHASMTCKEAREEWLNVYRGLNKKI